MLGIPLRKAAIVAGFLYWFIVFEIASPIICVGALVACTLALSVLLNRLMQNKWHAHFRNALSAEK